MADVGGAFGRPAATLATTRGACRLLRAHGWSLLTEARLPNGRRADIAALGSDGSILIVEVKSCAADFGADSKWGEYGPYCDSFYFALPPDGPMGLIAEEVGLIVADSYGGAFVRHPQAVKLAGARRRAMLIALARQCADRLHGMLDRDPG